MLFTHHRVDKIHFLGKVPATGAPRLEDCRKGELPIWTRTIYGQIQIIFLRLKRSEHLCDSGYRRYTSLYLKMFEIFERFGQSSLFLAQNGMTSSVQLNVNVWHIDHFEVRIGTYNVGACNIR